MGHSSSPIQAARKFNHLAKELREVPRSAVGASALLVKRHVMSIAPDRLRNAGKKGGAKLSVTYVVHNDIADGDAFAYIRAQGPWPLIESDTKQHAIAPKRKRAKRGRVAVKTPTGFYARVQHPGTKGKHPWAKGVATARPRVQAEFRKTLPTALRKVF